MRKKTHENTSPLRSMGVLVDTVDSSFFSNLTAPPICIRDEKDLIPSKILEARKELGWFLRLELFPCLESCAQTASIGYVFSQGECAIHV